MFSSRSKLHVVLVLVGLVHVLQDFFEKSFEISMEKMNERNTAVTQAAENVGVHCSLLPK